MLGFTLFTATATPSTVAQFWPFTKRPKTSLYWEPTNSVYSSDPNA